MMDTVKLEAKWPPDRKTTIEASEFGIYKEPADGKRFRGTDMASGCLLILSLIAAAAVVVYFTFFDYTIPTTQTAPTGPIVSYAKYVKEKQSTMTTNTAVNRSTDALLAAVLGMKNAENFTSRVPTDEMVLENRNDDKSGNGRLMRLYKITSQRPAHLSYDSNHWKSNKMIKSRKRVDFDGDVYGFNRRSDFPQLGAYRAPFPPKSIVDVMKYVTGPPYTADIPEYMMAQESKNHYVPIRPADEVNKFLPEVNTPKSNSKRFRNKFGPPVFLTPPVMQLPDDFMKPPNLDAPFSMDFERSPLDLTVHEGSDNIPLHTDVVFHSPTRGDHHDIPDDAPKSKKSNNKRIKNKKPISVMVDIYPITDHEHENEQVEDDEDDHSSEVLASLKNYMQQSKDQKDNLFFRLNLFPKFSERNRRIFNTFKYDGQNNQRPITHLTTHKPIKILRDQKYNKEEMIAEYTSESKNIENVSKIQ